LVFRAGVSPKQQGAFASLLIERASFFKDLLGAGLLERMQKGKVPFRDRFDIAPKLRDFDVDQVAHYWSGVLRRFRRHDPELRVAEGYCLQDRINTLRDGFFDTGRTSGLAVLGVGCYHTRVYHDQGLLRQAEAFLRRTSSEDFLLIAFCSKNVMIEKTEERGKGRNRFLALICRPEFEDRVCQMQVPTRPEFHFGGHLWREGGELHAHIGFETHHRECHDERTRVESHSVEAMKLALLNLGRYFLRKKCPVAGNLSDYVGRTIGHFV
jgi:hypothetical protein